MAKLAEDVARRSMLNVDLEPLVPYPGARKPWLSRCLKCGNSCAPQLRSIRAGQRGCGYCAGNLRVDEGVARRRMIDAGVEPLVPYPGVNKPWPSRCLGCGRDCAPWLHSINQGQRGCSNCGHERRATAQRSKNEDSARRDLLNVGLKPLDPYPGAFKPWRSLCLKCGNECSPRSHNVRNGQGGCDYCGRQQQVVTVRRLFELGERTSSAIRLDEDVARQFMRNAGLEPLEPYLGGKHPWKCLCLKCGRKCAPRRNNILSGQGGCRYCAEYGFDHKRAALIYLMRHDELNAVKIGITGMAANHDRIASHARHGWRSVFRWSIRTGDQAWEIEQEILRWWREEIGAPPALSREQMPQGGWTETVSLRSVSMRDIRARVELMKQCLGVKDGNAA
jgi:hypothetical protein